VADNIGGGNVLLTAMDSTSDAGYQDVDESDDEVLSRRRRNKDNGVLNLMQRRVRARLN
jgi:hypothetical protein